MKATAADSNALTIILFPILVEAEYYARNVFTKKRMLDALVPVQYCHFVIRFNGKIANTHEASIEPLLMEAIETLVTLEMPLITVYNEQNWKRHQRANHVR